MNPVKQVTYLFTDRTQEDTKLRKGKYIFYDYINFDGTSPDSEYITSVSVKKDNVTPRELLKSLELVNIEFLWNKPAKVEYIQETTKEETNHLIKQLDELNREYFKITGQNYIGDLNQDDFLNDE